MMSMNQQEGISCHVSIGIPAPSPLPSTTGEHGRTISRDAIAGLIREMMPADAIAWQTSDGDTYTAEEISREVEEGTEIGHQYARDIMRVAIDFLRRQARRNSPRR